MTPERIADITFYALIAIFVIWLLKKPNRFGAFCFGAMVLIAIVQIWKKSIRTLNFKLRHAQIVEEFKSNKK